MSPPFSIRCCDGWRDVTNEVQAADPPWTFAKPDGFGAFQFSIATYKSGRIPNSTPQELLALLRDFAHSRQLGEPTDIIVEDGDLRLAAGSFRLADNFLRLWYASDCQSSARVTYTCAWGKQKAELADCERMIRTLRFEYEKRMG